MLVASDASPVGIFFNADAPLAALLDQARQLAAEAGVSAYLVGGPVRDDLLGLPVKDLDVSVVGDAPALAARLAEMVNGRLTVHRRFGTATVSVPGASVDLVTARSETYRQPGALPEVRPGSIADDLARRDFTVNAMAVPLTGDASAVVDHHGGQDDLRAGVIRTLHPASFRDDPTRIFRAVRYSTRLGFSIARDTLRDLRAALAGGAVSTISGDRVRHELERTLLEPDPLPALRLADEVGALRAVHPRLSARRLSDADFANRNLTPTVWLSALVWNLSDGEANSLAARINAPADWARAIADTATLTHRLPRLAQPELTPSEVCVLLDGLSPDALEAGRMLAPPVASSYLQRYQGEWQSVAPALRGSDLLELGVPAGPAVGEALRALRKARLDGEIHSVEDERRLARQWASQSS